MGQPTIVDLSTLRRDVLTGTTADADFAAEIYRSAVAADRSSIPTRSAYSPTPIPAGLRNLCWPSMASRAGPQFGAWHLLCAC